MDTTDDAIRVLHVDDDHAFVELASEFLEREHDRIRVVTATSAASGRDVLATERIDCVVSDYEMPGENGIDFLETVRARRGDLPFILFTGKGSEEIASEAISAGVTDYVRKGPGTDQYTILANRVVNAVEAARSEQRAARQKHINTLIRELNRRLVTAETVDEIERAVCQTLADSEPYRFAWVGEPDPESGEIVPRTWAGDAEAYLDEVSIYYDDSPRGQGPGGRAVRTGEIQVAQNIPTDRSFTPWHDVAEKHGYESVLVIPLRRGGALHGILPIYADHPDAFSEEEQAVLAELGETIGSALEAAETRRQLDAHRAAEMGRREQQYRTVIDALPKGAVALFDTDLRYTVVDEAVFDSLGLSTADLEGNPVEDVHSPPFREASLPHYRAALDGETRTFTVESDGQNFEFHVAPIRAADGTIVGGIVTAQDAAA